MTMRKEDQKETRSADLMTMEAAAHYLHSTDDTLRSWIKKKQIAYYQIGRRKMFKLEDLDNFIESNRVESVK